MSENFSAVYIVKSVVTNLVVSLPHYVAKVSSRQPQITSKMAVHPAAWLHETFVAQTVSFVLVI